MNFINKAKKEYGSWQEKVHEAEIALQETIARYKHNYYRFSSTLDNGRVINTVILPDCDDPEKVVIDFSGLNMGAVTISTEEGKELLEILKRIYGETKCDFEKEDQ